MKLKTLARNKIRRAGYRLPDGLLDSDSAAMRRMAQLLDKNDVVIDLGAHVGNASIEFSHCARQVFSFEPNPHVFAELKAQTKNYPNITIFNKAVSDQTGTAKLYFETPKPGRFYEGATIMQGKSNVGYGKYHDVDTISIADVLDLIGETVAVVKMDIEGAEYLVLDAMIASGRMDEIQKVYIECHVDRIAGLAEAKANTLAAAEAAGVLQKLDFTWP